MSQGLVFVLGHSAGGVISLICARTPEGNCWFYLRELAHEVPAPDLALAIIKGVSHIAPHAHVLNLKDDFFSRDASFVERMKNDPLIEHVGYPSQTVADTVRADERLKKEFPLITLSGSDAHGTEDKVTVPHGSQRFAENAGSTDKTPKLYEGHFHDLLNDVGRGASWPTSPSGSPPASPAERRVRLTRLEPVLPLCFTHEWWLGKSQGALEVPASVR